MMGCVFVAIFYHRIIETMHKEIEKYGIEVTKTFTGMVTPYIFESDYVTIIDNTDELIQNSDIRSITILDMNGVAWLTTENQKTTVTITAPFYQDIIKNKALGYRQVGPKGHRSLELVNPITALGEVVYLLKIEFSLENIENEADARIREATLIVCIMIGVAMGLGGFLSRLLIEPLHSLVRGTNEIARGNFSHRIEVTSNDEIGILSRSFNLMTNKLEKEQAARKEAEKELKEHHDQLEQTVLARTAELTEINLRISNEIEEHRKTVLALRESEERNRKFSEVTIDGIVFHDRDGIVDINATFSKLFGYSREEVRGRQLPEVLQLPKKTDILCREFVETVGVHKNGSTIHLEMLSRQLENQSHLAVTSIRNIDDRKLLESRLQQAERMESIGLLAGGVAHDLNNILTGLVGYPEYLLLDLPKESSMRQPLEMIKESGLKAADVVSDLLTIARGAASVRELSNLNVILTEYTESPDYLRVQQVHPGIRLKVNLDPNLWNMNCSPTHVRKSLMNLLSNAAEAIGEEGDIGLSTWNEYVDGSDIDKNNLKEGEYVVLSISDSGTGLSDEDKQHIFEPFFSRKKMGFNCGSGLGLTVVWNTAQDHGGTILVDNRTTGTTFRMYFPASRASLVHESAPVEQEQIRGNGESLLVVDDDERQRIVCSHLLRILGYKVSTVASGEDALLHLETHPVDLLVLDMILGPGMNGKETYIEVRKRFPDMKAIIVSGFSADKEVRETQRIGAGRFVKKPYTIQQLGAAIKEVFDS